METNDLYFSIHDGNLIEEKDNSVVILFCPKDYWDQNNYLPDYWFKDELNFNPPKDYKWLLFTEEAMWITKKAKEDVMKELTSLGFEHNKALEKFFIKCCK